MISFASSFTKSDGSSFDANEFYNKFKASHLNAVYGITKSKNKGNAALHLCVNTYGSPTKNIPARDSLCAPVKKSKNSAIAAYKQGYDEEKQKAQNIGTAFENALNKMCFSIINDIVRPNILANGGGAWPALKPATVKSKHGSTQMLIKSGEMFDCLSWEVRKV